METDDNTLMGQKYAGLDADTLRKIIDFAVATTGDEGLRNPGRRGEALWIAGVIVPDTEASPGVVARALNLAGAAARAAAAVVRGEPVRARAAVIERRRAICLACPLNGERDKGDIRCTRCGCGGLKLTLATESCPDGRW